MGHMIIHTGSKLATFHPSLRTWSSMYLLSIYLLPNAFEFVELDHLSLLEIPSRHGWSSLSFKFFETFARFLEEYFNFPYDLFNSSSLGFSMGNTLISISPLSIPTTWDMDGRFSASTCEHKRAMLTTCVIFANSSSLLWSFLSTRFSIMVLL